MQLHSRWLVACRRAPLVAMTGAAALAQAPSGPVELDFDRDIRPLLSNHCFQCHGPDAAHRKAELRLDRKDEALRARADAAPAIVPGDAAGSELVRRILHPDASERMPPSTANKPLDARQQELLVRWIDAGAPWAEHWSFVAPTPPIVPAVTRTAPGDAPWATGEIDRFVLARLGRDGLRPSPAADRRTLLRRVTLDLTGLPPTPDELREFLADGSAAAYERVVDRLLATEAYGEHMARFWLDAARYGDTHGLHLDNYREMWPYRDWVVRAFCANLPFDRFIVEQLAGDLLPEPTVDQRIASGFNRCHITTNEGGSIDEEVYVRNVIDRVSTTGTVFLGLTVGCAVCHDHKFDPISQREFYQLFAFFNNLDGGPLDGNRKDPAPVLQVPSDEQTARLAALAAQAAEVEQRIAQALSTVEYAEPAGAADGAAPPRRQTIVWVDDELPAGAELEGAGLAWTEQAELVHTGRRAMVRRSRGNQQHYFRTADQKLRVAGGDVLFAWVRLDPEDPPAQIMLQWNDDGGAGWDHRAYWGADRIGYGVDGTVSRRRMGDLPAAGEWVELRIPVEQVGLRAGMAVHGVAFTTFGGTSYWDTIGIETSCSQEPEDYIWIDDEVPAGSKPAGDGRIWQWVDAAGGDAAGGPIAPSSGERALRRAGKGLSQDFFTDAPAPLRLQSGDRLFAHVWLDADDPPRSVQLQFLVAGSWNHRARWGAPAHGAGQAGGGDHVAGEVPATGRWVRLEVGLAEVGLAPGDRITGWAFTQVDGTVHWDRAGVRTHAPPDETHLRSLSAWAAIAKDDAALPADLRAALAAPAAARSEDQQGIIRDHFLRHVYADTRALLGPFLAELAAIGEQRNAVTAAIPTTLVMREREQPRPAYLLLRGMYDQRGDEVVRRTPDALPEMAADLPRDRLGLARWLVDPRHPLTARVAVNRFWQQLFGIGLVKTSEDFGNQGERPSHPQLLDWLATTFVADGWDVKRLMKRMVMSATYRQATIADRELRQRDPDNRLLARGPRFRLDGEALRDQALSLGGLLVRTVGGPSVKPPQPAGLWKAVGYSSSNTANFKADEAPEKVHRRSLYTFWKRTAPPPQMTTFDAPSREECRVRRERTNTPMQALLLMNDPQFVEAARGFAGRILREGGADDAARAAWALQCATCQQPRDADVREVMVLLEQERAAFGADPAAADRLLAVGVAMVDAAGSPVELAAWTMVANLILNLDAVVTKG